MSSKNRKALSKAGKAFDANAADIDRLLELHAVVGGPARGKRVGLEVLNKSAIVLITAIWEAYCEDLASEALQHIVTRARTADALSKHIKQLIARELKEAPNQIAVWNLAGDGWRQLMRNRLQDLRDKRNRQLNTPKADQIDALFYEAIGLDDVSKAWHWRRMSIARARGKLDDYVTLRGDIAHRGSAAASCHKSQVVNYFGHVKTLVAKTAGEVNRFVSDATGKTLSRGRTLVLKLNRNAVRSAQDASASYNGNASAQLQ
jgi:hypothetical protein